MNKISTTLAALHADIGALAGVTSYVGRKVWLESDITQLGEAIDALTKDGAEALVYLSADGGNFGKVVNSSNNPTAIIAQMVVNINLHTDSTLELVYDKVFAIGKIMMDKSNISGAILGVTWDPVEVEGRSTRYWIVFEGSYNFFAC